MISTLTNRAITAVFAIGITLAVLLTNSCVDLSDPEVLGENVGRPANGTGTHCADAPATADDDLILHFIDVGQGDAIWIQTPDDGEPGNGYMEGLNVLVDAGRVATENAPGTGQFVVSYLENHGRPAGTDLDWFFITHAHADHYGGGGDILRAFNVLNIADPGLDNDANSSYSSFLTQAQNEVAGNGGQFYRPVVGTLVDAEYAELPALGTELSAQILNAESQPRLGEADNDRINNSSIVLSLTYADVNVLLMGDAQSETESELIESLSTLRANILKVGHHGSSNASSERFLSHIFDNVPTTRRVAVIQSGVTSFGGVQLPTTDTLERLGRFIESKSIFSTEFGDAGRDESDVAGDDHVQVIIGSDGSIRSCYVD